MNGMADLTTRPAVPADAEPVFTFVAELAAFERLSHEVASSPASLAEALFAPNPRVFCDIAEWRGEPAGFALWFYDFSTFEGRHGIYLEDLFVRPAFRGRAVGKRLLQTLAARCLAEGLPRLSWAVLDWNTDAVGFYRAQGAELRTEWTTCRVSGAALRDLGAALSIAGP